MLNSGVNVPGGGGEGNSLLAIQVGALVPLRKETAKSRDPSIGDPTENTDEIELLTEGLLNR